VAALLAYVLVGAFLGLAGWKLTETAVSTRQDVEQPTADATVVVPPPPPVPTGPHQDAALLNLLRRNPPPSGTEGLYIHNLTTGAEASVNADRVFAAASLYKLPIMVETIRQIQMGRISPDQLLVVGRANVVPGSGVLQGRVGDSLSVRELLRLMIGESDNIAAMMLADLVGLNNVNQTSVGLGLQSTRLLDWRAPGANDDNGPYTTSPGDMGRLLETIADGRLVDQATSDEALRLMGQKQTSELLGELLPWNVRIAHKWGEIPGAHHDAGIVYAQNFKYVIVVMTENTNPEASPVYIRNLSKTVYDFFSQSTPPPPPPRTAPEEPAEPAS
jgi:beta-lactamase class A